MRVLALADKRPPMDPALMAAKLGVQAVICLGDLDRAWIEPLTRLPLPKVGVHGNHDPEHLLREVEVDDLHGRRTSLSGMTVAGFEGCVRYGSGGPPHHTPPPAPRQARRGLRGLRALRLGRPAPLHPAPGLATGAAAPGRRDADLPLPALRHQR